MQLQGLVESSGPGTTLVTPEGRRLRLVLGEESAPLSDLDGQMVRIEGQRGLGAVHVTNWKVPEGPHGMEAWIGALEPQGSQLGLADHNSGAYYLLDGPSSEALWGSRGHLVILEAYVVGPHRLQVTWWQDLEEEPRATDPAPR